MINWLPSPAVDCPLSQQREKWRLGLCTCSWEEEGVTSGKFRSPELEKHEPSPKGKSYGHRWDLPGCFCLYWALCPVHFLVLLQCPPLCSERTDHLPWPWSYIAMCTVPCKHRMFLPYVWRTGPPYVGKLVWKSQSSYTLSAGTSGQECVTASDYRLWWASSSSSFSPPHPLCLLLFLSLGQKTLDFSEWFLRLNSQLVPAVIAISINKAEKLC